MSSNEQLWTVRITDFAKSHYGKKFKKKYHRAWDITEEAIIEQLRRVDSLDRESSHFAVVNGSLAGGFGKLEFAVAGSGKSPKGSGCRAIAWMDGSVRKVEVLLVYSKNEIGPPNETAKWQQVVKREFPEYWRSVSGESGTM